MTVIFYKGNNILVT